MSQNRLTICIVKIVSFVQFRSLRWKQEEGEWRPALIVADEGVVPAFLCTASAARLQARRKLCWRFQRVGQTCCVADRAYAACELHTTQKSVSAALDTVTSCGWRVLVQQLQQLVFSKFAQSVATDSPAAAVFARSALLCTSCCFHSSNRGCLPAYFPRDDGHKGYAPRNTSIHALHHANGP